MFDLSGMTALVTGASGGLGSAIAKALAGQGARLAVSGSNVEKLESFRGGLGGDHVALACNLSDGDAVDSLVPQAMEALGGKLDILVNNAGVTRDNLLMRMKDEEFEEVIRINLEAAFRLMRDGPDDELKLTENAQPAIMANSIAVFRTMGVRLADAADFVAGHSLGEYSALAVAGSFDLATTAKLLKLRGQAMQQAVPVGEGAMAALLGADLELAQKIAKAAAQGEVCTVANDNDPSQVVLSGHKGAIDRAIEMAKEMGAKRAISLPVSAPFHCPLMQPAAEAMREALSYVVVREPAVPVFANVTAQPESDPDTIRNQLVAQVTGMVRWRESVANMFDAGVHEFVEIGGKVLGPMVKRIAPDAQVTSVVTIEDVEALAKEIA
jgi:[acyl-carrier-protein] S-malonyltransferase